MKLFEERRQDENKYFSTCREMIAEQNLRMSRQILNFLLVVYVLFVGMALLVLPSFRVHIVYLFMLPILLVFYLINLWTKYHEMTTLGIGWYCALFYMAILLDIILIDTLHDFALAAAWFPVIIVIMPALLIARMRIYALMEGLLGVTLLVISYNVKPPVIFYKDLFATMASIVVSMMGAYILLGGRIQDGLRQKRIEKMMEELRQAKEDVERASEAKSEFLSRMSHEIRTPINAMMGMDEMILRDCDDSKLLEYATYIRQAGSVLLSEVNDILDLSKVEAGKMEIVETPYDLSVTLTDVASMFHFQAHRKHLTVNYDIDPGLPRHLRGDVIRIRQCLLNLLSNAVKYTDEGGVTLSIRQEGTVVGRRIRLRFSVTDTGRGIREADQARLTKPFERLDEEYLHSIEGTGLGLSIVTKVLSLMHSKLELESTYGKGSTFFFVLEQEMMEDETIGKSWMNNTELRRIKSDADRMKAPKAWILIVDDNEMNLMVAKGLLEHTGIHIDTALSGEDGLLMMEEVKYDMIFLDQRMPRMTGTETLQKLRSMEDNPNAGVPCVVLTADAVVGARETYLGAGFDDYLTKPFVAESLIKLLIQFLPPEKVEILEMDDRMDEALGKKNCGDDTTYGLVREKFFGTLDEKADEIATFFEAKDWENFGVKVHALKTSARLVGATKLSEMAAALEQAADDRDEEYLMGHGEELLRYFRSFADLG